MLCWASSSESAVSLSPNTPILFVLPGLTGDETEWYIQNIIGGALEEPLRWRPVVYVRRGCGIPLTSSRPQDYTDGSKYPDGDMAPRLEPHPETVSTCANSWCRLLARIELSGSTPRCRWERIAAVGRSQCGQPIRSCSEQLLGDVRE